MSITGSNNPFACEPVVFANANSIVSLGTITRDGNQFTFSVGFVWKINGVTYQNTAPVVLTIAEASTGFQRIDNALLNTSNTIELQQGLESATIALQPVAPDTNIILTSWNISGNEIEDTATPIVGDRFVEKTDFNPYNSNVTGTDAIIPLDPNGYSEIRLTNTGLISIAGYDLSLISGNANAKSPYPGKPFIILNITGHDVVIKKELPAADYPFYFSEESDLVFPNNHYIYASFDSSGFRIIFKSWVDLSLLPTPISNHSGLNLDDGTNPHGTTKSDVGLSNVDNTSDVDKPISTATQQALDLKANTDDLGAVAFSNDYNDLDNLPTIPTATSELTNDSGFITIDDVPIPDLSGLVPYTGATQDVDLGSNLLKAESVTLNPNPTTIPTTQGSLYFDAEEQTVAAVLNGSTMKIGEDLFYQIKNQTGTTIPKGTAVRFGGVVGSSGRVLAVPFLADGSTPSIYFLGVTYEDIPNGGDGKALAFGKVRGVNTNAYPAGTILYASTTVAGGYQTTAPLAPNNIIVVAAVATQGTANGTLLVRPTIGSNINNDEGVKIVNPVTGDILQLQANGLWENKTVDSLGLQPKSEKGQPDGYAPLDSSGKLNPSYLPVIDLDDLGDVVITAPTEGQGLLYDATTGKWKNGTVATPAGVRAVETFTSTAGQTVFTTGGYIEGSIDVYLNGSRLQETEYTATDELTVVFPTGLVSGDIVEVVIWSISSVSSELTLDTSGFGDDVSYNTTTKVLTIDKYDWMDLARGYTVEPTLFATTATYEVYEYIYSSSTLYRKIMNDNSEDAFYSESALTNKLCEKKIIL